MRKIALIILLSATILAAQPTPPAISGYKWTGSIWTALTTTATTGAITYTPPAAALYCFNSGTSQWVPADSSCLGGGGSGTVSGQANGVIPLATAATVIGAQSHMDDGVTTASTITSSENMVAPFLDKGGAVFNVKAYGAKGDGSTDDTTAINSAIAAVNSAGHGILFFPQGVYVSAACAFTTITVPVLIEGTGQSHTWDSTTTGSQINCGSATANLFTLTSLTNTVRDMGFLNNAGSTPSAGAAIYANSASALARTNVENSSFARFYNGVNEAVGSSWHVTGSHFNNNINYGVAVSNTVTPDDGDWLIMGNYFEGNSVTGAAGVGIVSSGGGKIVSNKFNATLTNDVYQNASGSVQTLIQNNDMENCVGPCINIPGPWPYIQIQGNFISGAVNTTDISIGGNPTATIITGNNLQTYSSGPTSAYAITFTSATPTYTLVSNNNVNAYFAGQVNMGTTLQNTPLEVGCQDSTCNPTSTIYLDGYNSGAVRAQINDNSYAGNGMSFLLSRNLAGKGFNFRNGANNANVLYLDGNNNSVTTANQTIDDGSGNATFAQNGQFKGPTLIVGCNTNGCSGASALHFYGYSGGAIDSYIYMNYSGDGMDFQLPRNLTGKGYYFKDAGSSNTRLFIESNSGKITSTNQTIDDGSGNMVVNARMTSASLGTAANCSSSASPAVCAAAASGSVAVPTGGTTLVVNTTAVTANSLILLTFDSSLGTKLSVTCNTAINQPTVSARTAATSFTITMTGSITTNPDCVSYLIVN